MIAYLPSLHEQLLNVTRQRQLSTRRKIRRRGPKSSPSEVTPSPEEGIGALKTTG
jgi:hypothetical protein